LSQGDSHGASFTARSYDLAHPGVASLPNSVATGQRPVGIIILYLLSYRQVDRADEISVDVAGGCRSQHQTVLREYGSFTETLISLKQHAT